MSELGYVDETGEVFEIRAFVIEFAKAVVLAAVTLLERLQNVSIVCPLTVTSDQTAKERDTRRHTAIHRTHHAGDESVYTPTFLDKWYQRGNTAFIVG